MSHVIAPPHGLSEVRRVFGDIRVVDGIVMPQSWEDVHMVLVNDLPGYSGHKVYLNKAIEDPLREALTACAMLNDGYLIKHLGCFAPRAKRGHPDEISLHSFGIAVDINPDQNPRGNPMVRDIPDAWVAEFERVGWTWGGRFPTADGMHFQYATGC